VRTFDGRASYYGRRFHGRRTASGERFDMNRPTAAHRTLPFGTMVRVTNTANGKQVVVRINDRGPPSHSRVLDLSFGAALALDMIRSGIVKIHAEVLEDVR
jgi:rare lipoprotein A